MTAKFLLTLYLSVIVLASSAFGDDQAVSVLEVVVRLVTPCRSSVSHISEPCCSINHENVDFFFSLDHGVELGR